MEKYKPISITFKSGAKKRVIKVKHIDTINSEVSVKWTPFRPPEGTEEIHEVMAINFINHITPNH